jgi:(p)ppGpp synthase/HD superfamily hydrolase
MPDLAQTILLVRHAFGGLKDRGEVPLADHAIRVARNLVTDDPDYITTALLHDIVEDTHVDLEYLRSIGYSERVLDALFLLTHVKKEMDYPAYIQRLCDSGNRMALEVKLADQQDNLDPKRWLTLSRHVQRALEKKYKGVRQKLTEAYNAL